MSTETLHIVDSSLISSLEKSSRDRTDKDLSIICAHLRGVEPLSSLREEPLRCIARTARYEAHNSNAILYRKGQPSSCWYLLLSGCVFIEGQMFLPGKSFGKRSSSSRQQRTNDCLVLENAEMIAIDYPDMQYGGNSERERRRQQQQARKAVTSMCEYTASSLAHLPVLPSWGSLGKASVPRHTAAAPVAQEVLREVSAIAENPVYLAPSRRQNSQSALWKRSSSRSSESSSVHSDTGTQPSSWPDPSMASTSWNGSGGPDEVDLTGLPENAVDSDDDDESCPSGDSFLDLRDTVRECLERDPKERNEDDIQTLYDFMQHMPSFADLPQAVKKEFCAHMVFAIVEKANTIVLNHGEKLDSWVVLINGDVEITSADSGRIRQEYHLGDCFGVKAVPQEQFHDGIMRTLVDDCQFVLIAQEQYVDIMSRASENLKRQVDAGGEVVSETEKRIFDNGSREGYVVVKAKPERLVRHLIDEPDRAVDATFMEDMLLMYRTFIPTPMEIFEKLLLWFGDPADRDKITRVILHWANGHFSTDFETCPEMLKLLEEFERMLESEGMHEPQKLLNIACSVKSRKRVVTFTRSNRDEILHFSILGGFDKGYGIFISNVEANSLAEKHGLKRGDQILEVNSHDFRQLPHQKALEILRATTHLSITVKSNLLGFKEMLATPDRGEVQRNNHRKRSEMQRMPINKELLPGQRSSCPQVPDIPQPSSPRDKEASKLGRLIKKLAGARSSTSLHPEDSVDCIPAADISYHPNPDLIAAGNPRASLPGMPPKLKSSHSNPDITGGIPHGGSLPNAITGISQYYQPVKSVHPEHVLKVYRADQSFRYLTIFKETTAQNVVQLALQEFGMSSEPSFEYSLYDVSVTPELLIRQRRLPEPMQNLAERIALNSRYYLRNNHSSDPLVSDDIAPDLVKDSQITLLQLHPGILACQLTLQDFAVFASIEPTEYVDNLFQIQSTYGWPKLAEFEQQINRQVYWTCTEVCNEKSLTKRAKLVKTFIKIAKWCKDFKNFNSMFAILSGLEKPPVARLHNTWDKVPNRYKKIYEDLKLIIDPSRNMSRYRQMLQAASCFPPVIPLFPLLKKDLWFIHEGNKTFVDGLVNFEKLRMIAKEIRFASSLASAPYELHSLSVLSGMDSSKYNALLHMNSFDGASNVATMRRKPESRLGPLSRKKLYEEALMVRRIKAYLSELTVITDETRLDAISLEIEPSANSTSVLNLAATKRQPSPSPSTNSSVSNNSEVRKFFTGPKFGAESPQAVQKIMSLVETSRLRPAAPKVSHAPSMSPVHSPVAPRLMKHRPGPALAGSMCAPVAPAPISNHTRSQSESFVGVPAVDLTAESSSVTTLLAPARIPCSGSITSTDSTLSQQINLMVHATSCDSGYASMDAYSMGSQASPPTQRRSYPPPKTTGMNCHVGPHVVKPPLPNGRHQKSRAAPIAPATVIDRCIEEEHQISRV